VKLSEIAVKRPVTVLMMVFVILIMGFVSFTKIPLDMMPEIEIPIAVVSTSYQGVGPQEIEKLITQPLEEVVGTTANIDSLQSISREGSSMIIAQFAFGTDMNDAALELREKVDMAKGYMPDGAGDPMVFKFDPTAMPIMMVSFSSDSLSLSELQIMAEDTIKPRLERAEGVVSVEIIGGTKDVVEIRASSERLQGYGISMDYLANILRSENMSLPGGSVQQGEQELTVKTSGEFKSLEEIQQLLIPLPSGSTVQLNDLADVELKTEEATTISKANGHRSIDMMVNKQSGTNTVNVTEAAQKEMASLDRELAGVEVAEIYNTADYIKQSLNTVYNNGLAGSFFAVIILYLFLRNLRTTFIIAAAIPISIVATFSLLYFSGITLNMMTLGGLALGIGMLLDNSIVVLENIYRFRQDGYSRIEASIKGASEVSVPLIASTLTTLAVFAPIVFVQGLTSMIFKELALTVSFSLAASLLVAVTLVPMLCSKFLKVDKSKQLNGFSAVVEAEGGLSVTQDAPKKSVVGKFIDTTKLGDKFEQFFEDLREGYSKILDWVLLHRKKTIAIATIAFFASLSSIALLGAEFFPTTDEGFVQVNVSLPDGAELEKTVAIMDELETKMQGIPEIDTVFLEAGYGGDMMGSASGNTGVIYVKLADLSERQRDVNQVSDDIRERVVDTPGAKINVAPMESMGMGGGGSPISISVYGDDLDTLKTIGDDFVTMIREVEGTREVSSSYDDGIPEVEISIDRTVAAEYGLTAGQIAQAVRGVISGTTATRFKYDGTEIDVIIKGDGHYNENIRGLEQIPINTNMGFTVVLGQVANIDIIQGPVSINRTNQERVLTVSSNISGRDVGSISTDIEAALAEYQMPDKYYYSSGGAQQDMTEAFGDLGLALILAVLLVYMVMASQFESFLYPFIIMFAMPLGFAGGVFGLFLAGKPLSVPAIIGLIMLSGIVVNNSIVLVDYINTRRRVFNEDRGKAIRNACPIRLRPVLMTVLTTILAMTPLTLGIGEGSEMSAPLAIVIVGGLSLSTLVTLLVIPVLYTLFDDLGDKVKGKFKGKKNPNVKKDPNLPTAGGTTVSQ